MKKNSQIRINTEARLLATATRFTVCWFKGHDQPGPSSWEKETYSTLEDARTAKNKRGKDKYGRVGIVYAIAADTRTIHVE